MKRIRLTSLACAVVLLAGVATPTARAGSGSFTGAWTALDLPGDGSVQVLTIGSGPRPGVVYQDMFASVCANEGLRSTHFRAVGVGEVDGSALVVEFPMGGGCGPVRIGLDPFVYSYDPVTDTLDDGLFTWSRIR